MVKVPSKITPRVQEAHIFIGHLIAEYVEYKNTEKLNKMKLSDYVFQFIKDKGIEHVFMLPGGGLCIW